MISKESLFNKSIYKTNLYRFKWGALIYAVLLFLCVPFQFLTLSPDELEWRMHNRMFYSIGGTGEYSALLETDYLALPTFMAFVVPTVVALLLFNFLHSPRHGIFIHSMPVSRRANFVSTLLASFTLMGAPVLMNGLILVLMSLFGYGKVIGVGAALLWTFINLAVLFIMFSVASFSAIITGNSFALVGINAIVLAFMPIFALAVSFFSERFLYGYTPSSDLMQNIMDLSPIVWLFNSIFGVNSPELRLFFTKTGVWLFMAASVILYIAAFLLYKKRKIELCGDVAAFKIINPIFKYIVTGISFVFAYGIFSTTNISRFAYLFVTAVICAIIYFACEMVLRKNMRVFNRFKGLLAFYAAVAVVLSFFAFTGVFGFEKRVPKIEETESVSITDDTSRNTQSDNESIKEKAIILHKELIKNPPKTSSEVDRNKNHYQINIKYKLKNGKEISRLYNVDDKFYLCAMNMLFEESEYKLNYSQITRLNTENIRNISLSARCGGCYGEFALNENSEEFFKALKKDIEDMSYEEYSSNNSFFINISLYQDPRANEESKMFKEIKGENMYHFDFSINKNCKNTLAFLEENGLLGEIEKYFAQRMYVTKEPVPAPQYGDDYGKSEIVLRQNDLEKLEEEEALKVLEKMRENNNESLAVTKGYRVFCTDNPSEVYGGEACYMFN